MLTVFKVFCFGSVPLKAYLPDGDIDLTVLCHQHVEEDIARSVCSVLESQSSESWYHVKDVRYVCAQVKVVKCTVNGMPVDISFNQVAGLCTLCFLEQIDQLIGRDHLLKKSIILVKAWCYYESRILGAHHGLISTYGVETLVLYIINLFHSSLRGPLEVLHTFLDYYSTFDWDKYCISINGPVAISSLPEIKVIHQEEGKELLLSEEFIRRCRVVFSDPTRTHEPGVLKFPTKFLNIMDPLKDDNNLGRSVGKGSFYRIKLAFSYGAQKLRELIMLPGESLGFQLEKFFMTTIDRNGRGQRADVLTPVAAFGTGISEEADLTGEYYSYCAILLYGQMLHLSVNPSAPPSQIINEATWNALAWSAQLNWNFFNGRATIVYPGLQLFHFIVPPPPATMNAGIIQRSHGTGTFIPDVTQNYARYVHPPRTRETHAEASSTHDAMVEAPPESNQVEVSSEIGTSENVSGFNLSPEEFPLLPGTQRAAVPPAIHQSGQPIRSPPEEFPLPPGTQRPAALPEVHQSGQPILSPLEELPLPGTPRLAALLEVHLPGQPVLSPPEEFPLLPGTQSQAALQEVHQSDQSVLSPPEDFPPLARTQRRAALPEVHQPGQPFIFLEAFPLLPGSRRRAPLQDRHQSGQPFLDSPEALLFPPGTQSRSALLDFRQSGQPIMVSSPAEEPTHTSGSFKLGSSVHRSSQAGIPSPVASQQASTYVSYAREFIPGNSRMGLQKQQELPEVEKERTRMKQFKLDDDDDFPPLA